MMVDDKPQPARHGQLGTCAVCNKPVRTHFDEEVRFIGCTKAAEGTIFSLVPEPAEAVAGGDSIPRSRRRASPPLTKQLREFRRARYFSNLPDGKGVSDFPEVKGNRRAVLAALRKHPKGALARELQEKADLAHGAVSEALDWLRKRGYVTAEENDSAANARVELENGRGDWIRTSDPLTPSQVR
jgi:DNA-binding transcriptional ArsR family regulator